MLHEIDNAALVLVGDFLFSVSSLVNKYHFKITVEECNCLQTFGNGARNKLCAFCSKNCRVGNKCDGCASCGFAWRCTNLCDFCFWCATVNELLAVTHTVAVDFCNKFFRQRVDNTDTHSVQTTRNFVSVATKLATGVQHGEHYFKSRLAFVRTRWIWIDRNTAAVVGH